MSKIKKVLVHFVYVWAIFSCLQALAGPMSLRFLVQDELPPDMPDHIYFSDSSIELGKETFTLDFFLQDEAKKYKVVQQFPGSHGCVFLLMDEISGEKLALKIFYRKFRTNSSRHSSIKQAEQMIMLYEHNMGPKVLRFGKEFILTPFLDGGTREQRRGTYFNPISRQEELYDSDKFIELLYKMKKANVFPKDIENLSNNVAFDHVSNQYLIIDPGGLEFNLSAKKVAEKISGIIKSISKRNSATEDEKNGLLRFLYLHKVLLDNQTLSPELRRTPIFDSDDHVIHPEWKKAMLEYFQAVDISLSNYPALFEMVSYFRWISEEQKLSEDYYELYLRDFYLKALESKSPELQWLAIDNLRKEGVSPTERMTEILISLLLNEQNVEKAEILGKILTRAKAINVNLYVQLLNLFVKEQDDKKIEIIGEVLIENKVKNANLLSQLLDEYEKDTIGFRKKNLILKMIFRLNQFDKVGMNLVENEPERYGRALLKHIERERMVDRTNWMVLLLLRIKSHTLGSLDERVSTIFNGEWLETDFGSTDYEVNWTWIRLREIQPDHIFFPPEKKRNSNIFESFGEEQRRLREEREERKTRELAVSLQIKRGILPEEFVNPVVRPIYQWKSRKVQVDVRYSKGNIKELLDRLNEYMKLLDLDFLDGIMAPFRVFSPEVANKLFKNILTLLSDEQLNQSLPKAWKVKEFSRWLQMGMKMVTDPTLFESLAKLWIEINLVKEGSGLQLVANQENSRAILQFAFDSLERNPTNLIKITNESPAQYRLGLILSILRSWYEGKNEDQSKPKLLAWKPEVLARVSKLADLMKSQLQVAGISVEAKNDLHSSVNQLLAIRDKISPKAGPCRSHLQQTQL